MINLGWVEHRSGVHQMFPSSTDIKNPDGNLLVTTYAVHRPDGNWSLMLVNRDENNSHTVRVSFENAKEKRHSRSEERRVGKEGSNRGLRGSYKKIEQ